MGNGPSPESRASPSRRNKAATIAVTAHRYWAKQWFLELIYWGRLSLRIAHLFSKTDAHPGRYGVVGEFESASVRRKCSRFGLWILVASGDGLQVHSVRSVCAVRPIVTPHSRWTAGVYLGATRYPLHAKYREAPRRSSGS